jgi:hypothetical protein
VTHTVVYIFKRDGNKNIFSICIIISASLPVCETVAS